MDLTERQKKILKALIEEYIETAEPVGSETLEKKYSLGVSPATVRNELVVLTKRKYLRQPHTSAGRVPSALGFRFYIDELMEEKELSVGEEVGAKEAIWDYRFEFDRLMHEVTRALAAQTRVLAVASTEDGDIYSSGYANILDIPEFFDIDVTRSVLNLLDEVKEFQSLVARSLGEDPIHILLGEELGERFLEPCGFVFTHFETKPNKKGTLGVIGPSRLNYSRVIPTVRYFGDLIKQTTKDW